MKYLKTAWLNICSASFSNVSLLRLSIYFISLIASTAFAEIISNTNEYWSEYRNDHQITGYERYSPGSRYLETRSETIIDSPIEILLEVLKDISSYPQWMYQCTDAVLLKQEGEQKRLVYFSQNGLFGSSDRQVVIEAITTEKLDQGSYFIRIHSVDHRSYHISPNEDTDERQWMNEFNGSWDLRMIDRNRTKVVYTAHTDPGGFAPEFVVNRIIRNVTFRTLKNMTSKVRELKYTEAAKQGEAKKHIEAAIEDGTLVFSNSSRASETSTHQ